jgi:hypothetical protein
MKKIGLISAMVLILFITISAKMGNENWIYGGTSSENNVQEYAWYWANPCTKISDNVIEIEVGYNWTDAGRTRYVKPSNIRCTVYYIDFDLSIESYRERSSWDFDLNNVSGPEVLYPYGYDWNHVEPGTVANEQLQIVKRFQ